jgi:hypothetical protein
VFLPAGFVLICWLFTLSGSIEHPRRGGRVKKPEEVMEILEAYDLAGSLRGAAQLAGCDHKTVAHWVQMREQGMAPAVERKRPVMEAEFAGKVDELVARSSGRIRADVAHDKLVALGYQGSERTTRRWVAFAKRRWRREHGRVTRPWMPEPGLWMEFRLWRWAGRGGPTDGAVLRVAGVVTVSGRRRVARQDVAERGDGFGSVVALLWGRADVCAE